MKTHLFVSLSELLLGILLGPGDKRADGSTGRALRSALHDELPIETRMEGDSAGVREVLPESLDFVHIESYLSKERARVCWG